MQAKIMLLPGSKTGELLCAAAEDLLTEISAAFHHRLSLMREKIGERSIAAYNAPLTEEAVEACKKCKAVILCDGGCPGTEELYDAFHLPLRIRCYCIPDALCRRHELPVKLWIAKALGIDDETTAAAFRAAFAYAREENVPLRMIPPSGSASKALWTEQMKRCLADFSSVHGEILPADQAMTRLIVSPEDLGVLLCPPYAGDILSAAADALCPHPGLIYDHARSGGAALYAAHIVLDDPDEAALNPISPAKAVAHLLRSSLGLRQEADCLDAAINNVLFAGWRDIRSTSTEDGDTLIDRIRQQVAVAGELVSKGGFIKTIR